MRCLLIIILALSGFFSPTQTGSAPPADPPRRPAVLVHCPRPTLDQWRGWVDLTYLRELNDRGFEVDYTDAHEDFSWDRVRRYDVLVIYTVPVESGHYFDNSPGRPPYRDAFVGIVERFLEQGGGVLLMARSLNAGETFEPLLEKWGAGIPYERIVEADPGKLAAMPRMSGRERLWFTDGVRKSPVSDGVEQVWLPLTTRYAAAETMPIRVDRAWRVVLRGSSTSRTEPILAQREWMLRPADARARKAGVGRPALLAIRDYKAGRIAFGATWPQYSIGQGTQWLYERRVLSAGIDGRPSHFGRLIENTLGWLAEPSLRSRPAASFRTDPQRLVPPNLRDGVREAFVRTSARPRSGASTRAALERGRLHRGLFGAQTELGAGVGSVADYARVARETGLDYVVFLEDARVLDEQKLARLTADCAQHSTEDLALYPGYHIETNAGSRMFLFGDGVRLPPRELLIGERLNQQNQNPQTGAYETRNVLIDWLNYRMLASGRVSVGYFGFSDRPSAPRIPDLRLYSALALRLYRDGRLVEDNLADYLRCAAGTIPPLPLAVHFVASPQALRAAAEGSVGLTFVRASSVEGLWSRLGYAGQYAAPNVFTSDGPLIEVWPEVDQVYTFAAEDFVSSAAYLPAPIVVRSEAGLDEIRIYDGDRLFRRLACGGAKSFELTLELTASVQKTLTLVAEDVDGGRAVSAARRAWNSDLAPVFCGDRVNHCDAAPLLAKGPGLFQAIRTPRIYGGETWDGGPTGERPVLRLDNAQRPILVSDLGSEGHNGFANLPLLVFADEGAVRVRSVLERLYDDAIPVVNPWHTYGPLAGTTRLWRAQLCFTAFDRPSVGPRPTGHPGLPLSAGATISMFESRVEFLETQRIDSLLLFRQHAYTGPFPVTLVHGKGVKILATYVLAPGEPIPRELAFATGEWVGYVGPESTNLAVLFNRGEPLRMTLHDGEGLVTRFFADLGGTQVVAGEQRRYEILSVVDPVDATAHGVPRAVDIVRQLGRPEGLELIRGGALDHATDVHQSGLIELAARDGAVALRVPRPAEPTGVPLPIRVHGLNPRASAGLFLEQGYVLGNYGPGRGRYRDLGFDRDGRVYVPLFPDLAAVTSVVIGHPVICDQPELWVQAMRKDDRGDESSWHVSLNNPTDRELRTTCRTGFELPGLKLPRMQVTVPAGGYLVLH